MDIVSRYRQVYGLGEEVGQSEVDRHCELEARLTKGILSSTPDGRWNAVRACRRSPRCEWGPTKAVRPGTTTSSASSSTPSQPLTLNSKASVRATSDV